MTTDSDNQITMAVDAAPLALNNADEGTILLAVSGEANDYDLTGGSPPVGHLTTAGAAGDSGSAAVVNGNVVSGQPVAASSAVFAPLAHLKGRLSEPIMASFFWLA